MYLSVARYRQFYEDIRRWHFQLHCYFLSPKYKLLLPFFYIHIQKKYIDNPNLLLVRDQGNAKMTRGQRSLKLCVMVTGGKPLPKSHVPPPLNDSSVRLLVAWEIALSLYVVLKWSWMVSCCSLRPTLQRRGGQVRPFVFLFLSWPSICPASLRTAHRKRMWRGKLKLWLKPQIWILCLFYFFIYIRAVLFYSILCSIVAILYWPQSKNLLWKIVLKN